MDWNLFSWIRRRAAEAVALGVADGVKAITPEGEAPPDLDGLRQLLAAAVVPKSLPPAAEEEPARKGKAK